MEIKFSVIKKGLTISRKNLIGDVFAYPLTSLARFLEIFLFSWLCCKRLEILFISRFRKISKLNYVTSHERFFFSAAPTFDLRFSFSGIRKGW
jgi:hypothetical protein